MRLERGLALPTSLCFYTSTTRPRSVCDRRQTWGRLRRGGRSSKAMQHSVWIQVGGQGPRRFVPTELCALANKTANVIARSLYEVLMTAATRVQAGFGRGARPWLTHVLVGDGVASNEAAAKVVLP